MNANRELRGATKWLTGTHSIGNFSEPLYAPHRPQR